MTSWSASRCASAGSTASPGRVDDQRTKLYFFLRKKGGVWASTNKARIERLRLRGS